jgi:hypothetical protein
MSYEGCHILNSGSFTGRSGDAHNMAEDEYIALRLVPPSAWTTSTRTRRSRSRSTLRTKNASREDMQCCLLPVCRPGAISGAAEARDVEGVVRASIEDRDVTIAWWTAQTRGACSMSSYRRRCRPCPIPVMILRPATTNTHPLVMDLARSESACL